MRPVSLALENIVETLQKFFLLVLKMIRKVKVQQVIQFTAVFATVVLVNSASGAAVPCMSVNNQPGLCVTFGECPAFLRILQAPKIRATDIRLLQKYTCDFNVPKVCCPYQQTLRRQSPSSVIPISYPGSSGNPISAASSLPSRNADTISFNLKPPVPTTTTTTTTIKPEDLPVFAISSPTVKDVATPDWDSFLSEEETSGSEKTPPALRAFSFRNHPNFKLLPTLEECGNVRSEDHIVGGHEAAHGGHPWMARIGYRNTADEIEFYCSGTIISKRYIITAAHCSEEIDPEFIPEVIRVGEHNTTTDLDCSPLGCSVVQDYLIEKIIAHPGYNTDDKFNDIGIIRVNRDIDFSSDYVRPICLPFKLEYGVDKYYPPNLNGRKGIVAGWGRTKWNRAEGSTVLQEVFLPVVSNEECQAKYNTRVTIADKQMCAGGIKGSDSCGGDSGGPFILPVSTGTGGIKFFQVGVVSFGPIQCGVAGLPGVYSRISSYFEWLLNSMIP